MRTIIRRYVGVLAIVSAVVCWTPVHAAWQYTVIDFPGAIETSVFGMNDSGDAVGSALEVLSPTQAHPFAFVYDIRKGTYTKLARAFGEEFGTFGLGINNRGVVVGSRLAPPDNADRAVVRSKQGVYTEFVHPGSFSTTARAINDHGLISGVADDDGLLVGFLYDPATGRFTDFLPSPDTTAHSVNNRGDVVGSVFLDAAVACASCPDGYYGFLRTAQGTFSFFRVNGADTRARGLNDAGVVAGQVDTDTGIKSFVTRLRGLPYEAITIADAALLAFPGQSFTIAEGISNKGDVVGIYLDDTGRHGFVARESSQ